MFAVRYVALAALVAWVGGMFLLLLIGSPSAELARLVQRVAIVCGAVILVALFTMKFVGPPPRAFPLRAAVTGAMLAAAIATTLTTAKSASHELTVATMIGGLFLLTFYARE